MKVIVCASKPVFFFLRFKKCVRKIYPTYATAVGRDSCHSILIFFFLFCPQENDALRQQVKDMESISLLTNFPRSSILTRPKKTATVLCAVVLLFTLNFGAFK